MDVKDNLLRIINSSQLSNEQLIAIGKQNNARTLFNREIWRAIFAQIKADEMSLEAMIDLGKFLDDMTGWETVASWINFRSKSTEELLAIGRQANNELMWRLIIRTHKLSADQLMQVGHEFNTAAVWQSAFFHGDLTLEQKVEGANAIDYLYVWNNLLGEVDFASMNNDELLALARQAKAEGIWTRIRPHLNINKLSIDELLELAVRSSDYKLWEAYLGRFNLKEMSDGELLALGLKINEDTVWRNLSDHLDLSDLDDDGLIETGQLADNHHVWYKIIEVYKPEGKTADELYEFGLKARSGTFWYKVVANAGFSQDQLMAIGMDREPENWSYVFKYLDLSMLTSDQMMHIGIVMNSSGNWYDLINTGTLSADKLAQIALEECHEENHNSMLYVVKTGKMNADQLIAIGLRADCNYLWEPIAKALEEL